MNSLFIISFRNIILCYCLAIDQGSQEVMAGLSRETERKINDEFPLPGSLGCAMRLILRG